MHKKHAKWFVFIGLLCLNGNYAAVYKNETKVRQPFFRKKTSVRTSLLPSKSCNAKGT